MDEFTTQQVRAAMEALGLDPDTVESIYCDHKWVRIIHTDSHVTSLAVTAPEAD